ncbi:MAG TPA: SdiA-regulated domain-containing protein [Gemmatimonadales bacterium]
MHLVTRAISVAAFISIAALLTGGWVAFPRVGRPPGGVLSRYDLGRPPADRWELPHQLTEISGLAMDSAGHLFAHGDERAEIFEIDPDGQRILARFSFGEPAIQGDFEGIAVAGDRIFLVTSDGVLYAGRPGANGEHVQFVTYATGLGKFCEIESLAYDAANPSLLLGCKEPRSSQLRHRLAIYRWSIDRRALFPKPAILMSLAPITGPIGEKSFHPSDLTIDAATGHLLVLAGRQAAIAEMTSSGEVVKVARLQRRLHPQAEGIAITRAGSLVIADEGGRKRGTLTTYDRVRE